MWKHAVFYLCPTQSVAAADTINAAAARRGDFIFCCMWWRCTLVESKERRKEERKEGGKEGGKEATQ